MKRIHVGTLMLLVVIAALGIAQLVQRGQASRREAMLRSELATTSHMRVVAEESRKNLEAHIKQLELNQAATAAKGK